MTDKEKEAIERLKYIDMQYDCNNYYSRYDLDCIETILNLLEKKDKIIDLMIKVMIDSSICDYFIKQNCKHYAGENKKLCDVCIKEYFERKVENETSI